MTIRRANARDARTLLELVHALAAYERLEPPDADAQRRLVDDMTRDAPRFEAYLAEADGRAVGYAIIFETYSSFRARPVLYLEDLFVLPEYRQKKLGLALFRAVTAEAQQRGCCRVEWVVLNWNEPAIRFYRKLGAVHMEDWQTWRLPAEAFGAILEGG